MRKITVGNYDYDEIVLPSKINSLTLSQIDYMYPKSNIPIYPDGLIFRKNKDIFEVTKTINKNRVHVASSKDFILALNKLISFCEKHKLKV